MPRIAATELDMNGAPSDYRGPGRSAAWPRPVVLVVDDNEENRRLLARRLEKEGYRADLAADGAQALARLAGRGYDLVLLDIDMPRLDGTQVLEWIKNDSRLRHTPVIMVTAIDEEDSAVRCIEKGAEDYLVKPFNPVMLKARVHSCIAKKRLHDLEHAYRTEIEAHKHELEAKVQQQLNEISSAQLSTIFAMSKLAESKDQETGTHLERMREYCRVLGRELSRVPAFAGTVDEEFIDNIYAASPLHDIGKVGIPESILLKPGELTTDEWVVMRRHTILGAETLRAVDSEHPGNAFVRMGIEIAEHHHERWDGSGYPYGIAGESIPLSARILTLGDVYDALTSRRCYKHKYPHQKARAIIVDASGGQFDPEVVKAFLESEEEFKRIRAEFHDPDDLAQSV